MPFDGKLHPGARVALARLTMDELGIARAMAAGDLVSPQHYENLALFAMRITGTGTSFREKINEHVYRPPEKYLTQDFLDRCNGLPVIWEHPKMATLDTEEFAARAIGAIMLPYFKDEEVWGIAKIHDHQAAELMENNQLSTSPAVVFRDPTVNEKVKLTDGSTLLIEGKPSLLDHLAICKLGVWDKGGDASGILTETREDSAMPDDPDPEAAKKVDAVKEEEVSKLDKLLAGLGSLTDSVAGMSRRMDSLEDAEKARKDAAEKGNPFAKKDGEGEDPAVKKEEEEEEAAAAADAEAEKEEKAKADAVKADTARMIADALAAHLPRQVTETDRASLADAQARADAVYNAFGNRAPPPLQGELPIDYRLRLVKTVQKYSQPWAEIDLRGLPAPALAVAETAIYADAQTAARSPADLAEGQLREIITTDEAGRRITSFVGDPAAWMGQFRTRPRALVKPFFRRNANSQGA